ncbi:GNAT family N-acetyltransferase [Microbaculum marinum]|uniref:GNAT family N-acetyltransferase n=1 Tax=Microbaculum marinum TaxID=1764581 RepID=A0AAW9S4U8_9HYPH
MNETARSTTLRHARRDDADVLAELVNHAGEGLPVHLWSGMADPGQTAWDVGRARAARDEGSFSYRNATLVEFKGRAAGCFIGYGIGKDPEPITRDIPQMFVPLTELENIALNTWYVNVLAVLPPFRNLGLGSTLLRVAERTARYLCKPAMSIIVSDANSGARRLYERVGYREVASRPMVKETWVNDGEDWLLLRKDL